MNYNAIHPIHDHRIRLKISDLRNMSNGEVKLDPFDPKENIYCQIMIRESIPANNDQGNSSLSASVRRISNVGVINRFQRRRSSGISEKSSRRPSLLSNQSMQTASESLLVLSKRGSIISNMGTSYLSRQNISDQQQPDQASSKKRTSFSNVVETKERTIVTSGALFGLPSSRNRGSIRLSADSQILLEALNPILRGSKQYTSRRSSLGQFIKGAGSSSSLNIAYRIEINVSGSLVDEYELELNSNFHSILVCIIQKGLMSETVLRSLELPAMFFEPDEKYHDDWLTLHDYIPSTRRGHKFEDCILETTKFCFKCKKMLWNGDKNISIPVVQCEYCHLIAHPECCELIESTCSSISSLRFGYYYTNEPIFEMETYLPIHNLLLDPQLSFIKAFARTCEDREENAYHMIRYSLSLSQKNVVDVISGLCEEEISNTKNPQNLFRNNTMATKALDMYMKYIGTQYLIKAIEPTIAKIIKEDLCLEIDASRIQPVDSLHIEKRIQHLEKYTDSFLRDSTSCFHIFPFSLRCILARIFKKTKECFNYEPTACYLAVNSFLFLRFICPAILSPHLYGLFYGALSSNTQRTLVLTSKIIQKVANLCEFDPSIESFASPLNQFVPEYHAVILIFIDELCGIDLSDASKDTNKVNLMTLSDESIHSGNYKKKKGIFSFFSLCFGFLSGVKSRESLYSDDNMFKASRKRQEIADYSQELQSLNDPIQGIDKKITFKELHLGVLARQIYASSEKMLLYCKTDEERSIIYSNLRQIQVIKDKYALETVKEQRLLRLRAMQRMEYERVMDELKTRADRDNHRISILHNQSAGSLSSSSSVSDKEEAHDSFVVFKSPTRASIMAGDTGPGPIVSQPTAPESLLVQSNIQETLEMTQVTSQDINVQPTHTHTQQQGSLEPRFLRRQTSRMSVLDKLKDLSKQDPTMQFSSIGTSVVDEPPVEMTQRQGSFIQNNGPLPFRTIQEEPEESSKSSSHSISRNPELIPRSSFRTKSFIKTEDNKVEDDDYIKYVKFSQEKDHLESMEALKEFKSIVSGSSSQEGATDLNTIKQEGTYPLLDADSTILYSDSIHTTGTSNSNSSSQESIKEQIPVSIVKRNPSEINVGALMGLKQEDVNPNQRIIQIGTRRLTLSLNNSGIQMIMREKSPGIQVEERPVSDVSDDEDNEGETDEYIEKLKKSTRKALIRSNK